MHFTLSSRPGSEQRREQSKNLNIFLIWPDSKVMSSERLQWRRALCFIREPLWRNAHSLKMTGSLLVIGVRWRRPFRWHLDHLSIRRSPRYIVYSQCIQCFSNRLAKTVITQRRSNDLDALSLTHCVVGNFANFFASNFDLSVLQGHLAFVLFQT